MADFPDLRFVHDSILTPYSPEFGYVLNAAGATSMNAATSGAWLAANLALYYPFRLDDFVTVYQFLWYVGTTNTGNVDVGIYDSQLNLIVSAGSTAIGTASVVQELNITDTVLPPGGYLLGAAASATTCNVFRVAAADELLFPTMPVYEQASAFALPNPAAPALLSSNTQPPRILVGMQCSPTF